MSERAACAALCRICRCRLDVHQRIRGICDSSACRRADVPYQQALRKDSLIEQLDRWVKAHEPDHVARAQVLLPRHGEVETALPDARRQAFSDHLRAVLVEAGQADPLETPSDPVPNTHGVSERDAALPIAGRACGLCGGHCCQTGGTGAWLNLAAIRRYQTAHPQASDEDIHAAYLARLPESSIDGSCVFHRSSGCALPREMRSTVCNRYICQSLSIFIARWQGADGRIVAATVLGKRLERVSIIDGERITTRPADSSATDG